jgi:hypothetical protein
VLDNGEVAEEATMHPNQRFQQQANVVGRLLHLILTLLDMSASKLFERTAIT